MDRQQLDGVHPQPLQVVQLLHDARVRACTRTEYNPKTRRLGTLPIG